MYFTHATGGSATFGVYLPPPPPTNPALIVIAKTMGVNVVGFSNSV